MKILITGACGFVGSSLIRAWAVEGRGHEVVGFDNLVRPGSELNRGPLRRLGVSLHHGDLRCASDFESLPEVDVVIDAAANPSVLAGVDGRTSSRQVVEHNLFGTVNVLEYCRQHRTPFVLLSTSRVYSIEPLAGLPVVVADDGFTPDLDHDLPAGFSHRGVGERFSTRPPLSLYGSTKLASEVLALEYGQAFGFPVWIDRCGVLAGGGQFGRPDQGIYAFWLNTWLRRGPLRYIGFDGAGHQVRDCLHPADLVPLLEQQIVTPNDDRPRVVNVSGGLGSARSLRQLSRWCAERFGEHEVQSDPRPRAFDLPWMVLDATEAERHWDWRPRRSTDEILEEIATHAEQHPHWLDLVADA